MKDETINANRLAAEFKLTPRRIDMLGGGANNRVWRIETDAEPFVLKHYFTPPADTRDRFQSEYLFYTFLESQGIIGYTPEAIDWNEKLRCGLFSWVEGVKLEHEAVNTAQVNACLDFITALNSRSEITSTQDLLSGAEACFSLEDHLQTVARRVARLSDISCNTQLDRDACDFVKNHLTPAWKRVEASIRHASNAFRAQTQSNFSTRCISPSDFGFHNALCTSSGKLVFFDFEYAGWDSPHKLICDFFCQPQIPVDMHHWQRVCERLANLFQLPELETQCLTLLPAYQIKWCCILLNEFLSAGKLRRSFSCVSHDIETRKAEQLDKARHMLEALHENN